MAQYARSAAQSAVAHLDIGVDGAQGDAILVKQGDHLEYGFRVLNRVTKWVTRGKRTVG